MLRPFGFRLGMLFFRQLQLLSYQTYRCTAAGSQG
jgi:hypothetical protein